MAFPGRSRSVMGASMNADAHGRIRTTQSAIFEGSRLSAEGLGERDRSCTSSVSQSTFASTVPVFRLGVSAFGGS